MAGTFDKKDGVVYYPHIVTPFEEAIISTTFDAQCDFDIEDIRTEMKEVAFLKKVCLFKILLTPIEWIFTLVFFGKEAAKFKARASKLYWGYFRNKITIEYFQKELTHIMMNGKII